MAPLSADLYPRPAPADLDPAAHAAQVLARARSSFALGMRMLPKPRREAMFAVYSFSRTVDDIADEPGERDEKLAALAAWREEVDRVFAGRPRSLVGKALEAAIARYGLPQEEFLLMIEGMEMDVRGPVVAPPLAEFFRYTRRVAGTVGELSVRCFGAAAGEARDRFALSLADALQIVNIMRDVEEDAAEGRLYLPAELLSASGVPADAAEAAASPALPAVCRDLAGIARGRFAEARGALPGLDRRAMRPALMFMGVYEGYLARMERHGFRRTPEALAMPRVEKLVRGLRYAYFLPAGPARPAGSAPRGGEAPAR